MLGARIAALRRDAGMSQAALAKHLGISASAVGMYEQGRREPSGDMLVKLAEVFQVSVDYLLRGIPTQAESDRVEQMLCQRLDAADLRLSRQRDRPFSRQELAVLFAALLLGPNTGGE